MNRLGRDQGRWIAEYGTEITLGTQEMHLRLATGKNRLTIKDIVASTTVRGNKVSYGVHEHENSLKRRASYEFLVTTLKPTRVSQAERNSFELFCLFLILGQGWSKNIVYIFFSVPFVRCSENSL